MDPCRKGTPVSAQPLESRIAHIEGVNVQIADRLNGIDRRLDSLDRRLDSLDGRFDRLDCRIDELRSDTNARFMQIDQKFMWVIGINVMSWTTIMLAVLIRH
jgi:hypothetical protein